VQEQGGGAGADRRSRSRSRSSRRSSRRRSGSRRRSRMIKSFCFALLANLNNISVMNKIEYSTVTKSLLF
jgi:hypothetical protein